MIQPPSSSRRFGDYLQRIIALHPMHRKDRVPPALAAINNSAPPKLPICSMRRVPSGEIKQLEGKQSNKTKA
jgi:hypothetical protein